MGVKDLWQLLSAVGRRVSIETLETKILAIDVSIWITQFIKAMRDDEGKTIHNAHLIGSIRRILKLLFHRIRPVFVFDGTAPFIKQRTLRRRQNFRDSQDGNFKKLGQKLLMSRLKQEAIRAQLVDPLAASNTGRYVSSFAPPTQDLSGPELTDCLHDQSNTAGSAATALAEADIDADVEWEDGYSALNTGKTLRGRADDSDDDLGSADETDWDLPTNAEDIDVSVLASLPMQMRKDLIESTRRRERARRRSNYLPVAANPDLYSQTQIANFLRTSKFNQRVMEVQEAALEAEGGARIASEGHKKYIFQPGKKATGLIEACGAVQSETSVTSTTASIPTSRFFSEEGENEFAEPVWAAGAYIPVSDKLIAASPSRCNPRAPQICSNKSKSSAVIKLSAEVTTSPAIITFTQDPVPIAGDGESDYDNLEWESGLSAQESSVSLLSDEEDGTKSRSAEVDVHNSTFVNDNVATCINSTIASAPREPAREDMIPCNSVNHDSTIMSERAVHCYNVEKDDLDKYLGAEMLHSTEYKSSDRSVLEHAAATAAKMNDWAGREMQRFLKSHMKERGLTTGADGSVHVSAAAGASNLNDNEVSDRHAKFTFVENVNDIKPAQDISNICATVQSGEEQNGVIVRVLPTLNQDNLRAMLSAAETEARADKEKSRAYQRDSAVLTNEMKEEVMELLDAFGLPYIVAPSEAEAQCAIMEILGLVDGIVTEDSDSFLFGAKSVYKNIFNDGKYVEAYFMKDVVAELGMDQESLIAMAYLLGSDYTDGIKGVGIVNSTEVIRAFMVPSESVPTGVSSPATVLFNRTKESADRIVDSLTLFKKWVDNYAIDAIVEAREAYSSKSTFDGESDEDKAPKRLKRASDEAGKNDHDRYACGSSEAQAEKLRIFNENHKSSRAKWSVPASFPERAISEAYLKPEVSTSTQSFSWPVPELAKVSSFCKQRLGWSDAEIFERVVPVVTKCLEPLTMQATMDSYITRYQDNAKFARIKSKRLQNALSKEPVTGSKTSLNPKKIMGTTSKAGSKRKK